MTKRDTRLSDITCATCGYRLDAASEIGGGNAIPEDGNISVCLNCGQVGFYVAVGDKMTVRSATSQER
ncbi:hypothetical protein OFN51_37160, partial [Escherichia coli]|nr:hypothetical protein [Escherichia coli]